MSKFTGTLTFDVTIEEQDSEADVNNISQAIEQAINSVIGVNGCEKMDSDIDESEE
jgi:hypothetical protein